MVEGMGDDQAVSKPPRPFHPDQSITKSMQ